MDPVASNTRESLLRDYFKFDKVINERLPTFPDLIGFYELKRQSIGEQESLDFFMDFLSPRLHECYVCASLTDLFVTRDSWTVEDNDMVEHLRRRRWFEYERSNEDLSKKLTYSSTDEISISEIRNACQQIYRRIAHGYFFLIFPNELLMTYPHSTKGFGFVAKSGTPGARAANELLQSLLGESLVDVTFADQLGV